MRVGVPAGGVLVCLCYGVGWLVGCCDPVVVWCCVGVIVPAHCCGGGYALVWWCVAGGVCGCVPVCWCVGVLVGGWVGAPAWLLPGWANGRMCVGVMV